jgi:hypothetical protein
MREPPFHSGICGAVPMPARNYYAIWVVAIFLAKCDIDVIVEKDEG